MVVRWDPSGTCFLGESLVADFAWTKQKRELRELNNRGVERNTYRRWKPMYPTIYHPTSSDLSMYNVHQCTMYNCVCWHVTCIMYPYTVHICRFVCIHNMILMSSTSSGSAIQTPHRARPRRPHRRPRWGEWIGAVTLSSGRVCPCIPNKMLGEAIYGDLAHTCNFYLLSFGLIPE